MASGTNIREPKGVPGASGEAKDFPQEIDEAWFFEGGTVPPPLIPAFAPAGESKALRFAPQRKDDISSGERVAADYIDVEEGLRDEVLGHDSLSQIKQKISAETAEDYGLDPKEADLALRHAAAAKEVAQRTLTATPEESARLSDLALWHSLRLDLCLRLEAAEKLPQVLENKQQSDLASQLAGTFERLRKLEEYLYGETRTAKHPLVTRAEAQRRAYRRLRMKLETPTTPRPAGSDHPHLVA